MFFCIIFVGTHFYVCDSITFFPGVHL